MEKSPSASSLEKKGYDDAPHITLRDADVAAKLEATVTYLAPEEAKRIRKKIDRHILPLMMVLYLVQFMDKTTLGSAAIMGLEEDTHLDANEYNWLGTIFYLAYLVFEWPQNLALQRFPVGKWMTANMFVWSVALACQAACTSFAGLFVCRFFMGACEGSITAGFMIVTAMFYTHSEQSVRTGYWFLMNGTAQVISGLLAYGVLHISHDALHPWQWFFIITGLITLALSAAYLFFFPDSPLTAWFLTAEERSRAVFRIRENQSGVENKTFKRHQFEEALRDPKTWVWFLFCILDNIPNSLTNQNSLIIKSLGYTTLQTTLLGCLSGVVEVLTIWSGVLIVRAVKQRAIVGAVYFIPNIIGAILVIALPWSNKVGILVALYVTGVGTTGFVLALGWITSSTAGHTKRTTVQAIALIGYCIGNLAGPQMWQAQYKPRNYVPWGVIIACYTMCPCLMLLMRQYLQRENRRREAAAASAPAGERGEGWVDERDAKGEVIGRIKVDRAFMDLTDIENTDFRYAL